MHRREFLILPAAARLHAAAGAADPRNLVVACFQQILKGYAANCRRTSPSWAVCDFADGAVLPGSVGRSGKTYDSVSRMLPALAAFAAAPGRVALNGEVDLDEVLRLTFANAFDPEHPDYWLPSPPDRQNQRQVESSLVAWSAWLLRDRILPKLTPKQRANLQAWLASCTQVPVRRNNWAWFTAVNQAARIALAPQYPEFSGDAAWMAEDLQVLDRLAAPGNEGWYSDSPKEPAYDYYNFWVFASHFLYWNRILGARYPEWSGRFAKRLQLFLDGVPYLFGANGSHVLYGRSLIYRWAVLTPLVLAYQQNLWPHSPGLLRRILRGNLEYLWNLGAFDAARGKLRETFSAGGNREICDTYIDNGHPYWGMQAFAAVLTPPKDPLWTAPEEPLPVERRDFQVSLPATRMLLAGARKSGQVRWLQATVGHTGVEYRDTYSKFSYSSHFPFNVLKRKDRCAWDGNLVFRDPKTGLSATLAGLKRGDLVPGGIEREWWVELGELRFEITTRIQVRDEFETRRHTIVAPVGAIERKIEVLDGSYPLGLEEGETPERRGGEGWLWLRSARTGCAVASLNRAGFDSLDAVDSFEETGRKNVNAVWPRMVVSTLRAVLRSERTVIESLHYASPNPADPEQIRQASLRLAASLRDARHGDWGDLARERGGAVGDR